METDVARIDLNALERELLAADVAVRALGLHAGNLHTYDEAGAAAPLPPEAVPVVAAHTARLREEATATPSLREMIDGIATLEDVKRCLRCLVDATAGQA